MKKIAGLLIMLPAALVLLTFALANRHPVRLGLDPFHPDAPVLSIQLPFYAYLIGALILGVALGGISTWFNQGRWRQLARNRKVESRRWQAEADRLARERDLEITAGQAAGKAPGGDRTRGRSLLGASRA
jgi:uncharacterized integral membrane protein